MRTPAEIATAFNAQDELNHAKRFVLLGIGGAGMSALARMLKSRGHEVIGADSTLSPEVERLRADGIEVSVGNLDQPIHAHDAVVLSDAIDLGTNLDVQAARSAGAGLFRRSQLLGWLVRNHRVLAVTGTHGKTTTTGMIGSALIEAGLDPLVVVGANIPDWGGPIHEGKGEWAVVEACEAYNGFHDLQPELVVLTNLELDHVDFHGSLENLVASVRKFVESGQHLVYCRDDAGASALADQVKVETTGYSIQDAEPHGLFGVGLMGDHNLTNAMGARAAATYVGAEIGQAWQGIHRFGGAERRLQVLRDGEITVVDDYAHHPTEIEASLRALRSRYPGRRLVVVHQPHLYSRTAMTIPELAQALSLADEVVITDIYPAREAPLAGVSSSRVAELVTVPVRYVPSRHLLPRLVRRWTHPGDVVVGMGAGTIAAFGPAILAELDRPSEPLHVAVLSGGDSPEREVSLHSGLAVGAALQRLGHKVSRIDVTDRLLASGDLASFIGTSRPDVAFLALHGTNAEDGGIQGLLQMLHIPYTGSGIQASSLAMDKAMTKQVLATHGLRTPHGFLVRQGDPIPPIQAPVVVKPNAQGSTVGLVFVEDQDDLADAISRSLRYDESVLVEEWVRGMEISVPVLNGQALQPVEIAPASGRYDFASKYIPGATEEICPARLSPERTKEVQEMALRSHQALGCQGATRTDMIVREADVVILEVNTLPGMTMTSLLPTSAQAGGIEFDQLVELILQDAVKRFGL